MMKVVFTIDIHRRDQLLEDKRVLQLKVLVGNQQIVSHQEQLCFGATRLDTFCTVDKLPLSIQQALFEVVKLRPKGEWRMISCFLVGKEKKKDEEKKQFQITLAGKLRSLKICCLMLAIFSLRVFCWLILVKASEKTTWAWAKDLWSSETPAFWAVSAHFSRRALNFERRSHGSLRRDLRERFGTLSIFFRCYFFVLFGY